MRSITPEKLKKEKKKDKGKRKDTLAKLFVIFLCIATAVAFIIPVGMSFAEERTKANGEKMEKTVDLPVEVITKGLKQKDNRDYSVTLARKTTNAPMPKGAAGDSMTLTLRSDEKGKFEGFHLDHPEEYEYTVRENAGNESNIKYDDSVYDVVIAMLNDGSTYVRTKRQGDKEKSDGIKFTNYYKSVTAGFKIKKQLKGINSASTRFEFDVTPVNSSALKRQKVSIKGAGETNIEPVILTKPGVYTYKVTEKKGNSIFWNYDKSTFLYTIKVSEKGDTELKADTSITKDGSVCDSVEFINSPTKLGKLSESMKNTKTGDNIRMVIFWLMVATIYVLWRLLERQKKGKKK